MAAAASRPMGPRCRRSPRRSAVIRGSGSPGSSRTRGTRITRAARLSLGSTPTLTHVDHFDGIEEVRAGNYVFFDVAQATIGSCTREDTVLSVLAAVVHRDQSAGRLVVDAGGIALSKDRGAVDLEPATGYGELLDLEGRDLGLRLDSLSQEHGVVTAVDPAARAMVASLPVGSRVRIRVNHSCLTAAQHGAYVVHDGVCVVDRWVNHRGW